MWHRGIRSMIREENSCPYCDNEFVVEFEMDDSEVIFCPFCGEELFDEDEEDYDDYDDWDDED